MITIEYKINDLIVQHSVSESNVVKKVQYTQIFSDGTSFYNINNTLDMDPPSGGFTQFGDLTKPQIVSWIESKIFSGPQNRDWHITEAERILSERPLMSKILTGVTDGN
jgi:hypothetical protein